MTINIGGREIGEGYPCFIVAEIGVNHNGDVETAYKLIDEAKKAGANAVKFQTFDPAALAGPDPDQVHMLEQYALDVGCWSPLRSFTHQKGLQFLSTPFDKGSVDLLAPLVHAFKVGSGDLTDLPLLRHIASKGKPMIISTGMASLGEIEEALDAVWEGIPIGPIDGDPALYDIKGWVLMHCTSVYPAIVDDLNLRAIQTLKQAFGCPVGYSDHSRSIEAVPAAAVTLGAVIYEKHLTLNRDQEGPDHMASLTPAEFELMVDAIRATETALGNGWKTRTEREEATARVARKSLVAKSLIMPGTVITEDMVEVQRPGTGVSPSWL